MTLDEQKIVNEIAKKADQEKNDELAFTIWIGNSERFIGFCKCIEDGKEVLKSMFGGYLPRRYMIAPNYLPDGRHMLVRRLHNG